MYVHTLDELTLEVVAQEVFVHQYEAGEIIFLEGDVAAGLHLDTVREVAGRVLKEL